MSTHFLKSVIPDICWRVYVKRPNSEDFTSFVTRGIASERKMGLSLEMTGRQHN